MDPIAEMVKEIQDIFRWMSQMSHDFGLAESLSVFAQSFKQLEDLPSSVPKPPELAFCRLRSEPRANVLPDVVRSVAWHLSTSVTRSNRVGDEWNAKREQNNDGRYANHQGRK